jgi:hypothetical protein
MRFRIWRSALAMNRTVVAQRHREGSRGPRSTEPMACGICIAERCKMVAGSRSEAETPGRSPSKKGRHPEGVPQKVYAPPTPPNLEARAFRQPTPQRRSGCWLRSSFRRFMAPMRVRIWRSALAMNRTVVAQRHRDGSRGPRSTEPMACSATQLPLMAVVRGLKSTASFDAPLRGDLGAGDSRGER